MLMESDAAYAKRTGDESLLAINEESQVDLDRLQEISAPTQLISYAQPT
jgi:hypothetical protein